MKESHILIGFTDKLLTNVQANKDHPSVSFMLVQLEPSDRFSHLEAFPLQTKQGGGDEWHSQLPAWSRGTVLSGHSSPLLKQQPA